jgi:hypothetical protein
LNSTAFATRRDGNMIGSGEQCGNKKCIEFDEEEDSRCLKRDWPEECKRYEPLKGNKDPVADVLCNVGLDTLFFMEKRLPHLLNIAEELLTWCIEEDKKGIYRDYIKKYRKEHEDIIEKGV